MSEHVCRAAIYCTCSVMALEPADSCPVHGYYPYPHRCQMCGRFMKQLTIDEASGSIDFGGPMIRNETEVGQNAQPSS